MAANQEKRREAAAWVDGASASPEDAAAAAAVKPSGNPPSSVTVARLISRVSESPNTSIVSGAKPARLADDARARAE